MNDALENHQPDNSIESPSQNKAEGAPREIEAKIVNLGDPQDFVRKVKAAGGKEIIGRRLLRDFGFKQSKSKTPAEPVEFTINTAGFNDQETLQAALRFLGLEITAAGGDSLTVKTPVQMPRRMVRVREDGDKVIFTTKEKRKKDVEYDDRVEIEVGLSRADVAQDLLARLGYHQDSLQEKYRTTFQMPDGVIVELNEGPQAAPWAEIEVERPEQILATAQKLGYTQQDLAGISDKEYYRRQGVSDEELKRLVFKR